MSNLLHTRPHPAYTWFQWEKSWPHPNPLQRRGKKPNALWLHTKAYILLLILLVAQSCKKHAVETLEENITTDTTTHATPVNPYSLITPVVPDFDTCLDPSSLVCLQQNIFQVKCANPGCHDGNFEPDFRTVQSTYNTLVYHPIIKNNAMNDFRFRVIPYDTAGSVLYERLTNCCFVNTDDRMPQDNIGVPLPQEDINNIATWIMNGAPDNFGNINQYPNREPYILPYYFATDAGTYTIPYSSDTNRVDDLPYNPFILPNNQNVAIFFLVEDDSTNVPDLLLKTLKLSLDIDDFSNPVNTYNTVYFMDSGTGDEFLIAYVNTTGLPQNQPLYMRFTVNDGDHTQDTYFPTLNMLTPYKTYWSFVVQ